jgi:S-adenosylmethionine/arginine decarboxylase-like enzyme
LKDEAILTGLDVALKKVWADAGGAKGKEWDQLCENCQKCLKARTGEWAEKLVKELGEGIIKEFAGKALDLVLDAAKSLESIKDMVEEIAEAKEAYDKAKDKAEKLEELKGKIEDAIRAGELKVVSLEPKMCDYCLISGLIFYCPQTGCVTAVLKCQGGVLCCPTRDNSLVLHYCTDDRGMPSDKRGGVGVEVIKK